MNKNLNVKNRTFVSAVILIVVSAIVITSTTFAWFILGKDGQINKVDVKIVSESQGIQISADGVEWVDGTIDFSKFNRPENTICDEFKPVSNEMKSASDKFFAGRIDASRRTLSVEEVPSDAKYYHAFNVYLKASQPCTVNMKNSTITVKEGATNPEASAKALNAMRVGFVKDGTNVIALDSSAKSVNPITGAGTSDELYGVDDAKQYFVPSARRGTISLGSSSNVKVLGDDASTTSISLDEGSNTVKVYVWLEGQDPACANDLMAGEVSLSINFAINE